VTTDVAKRRELAEDRDPWTKQPWESWPAFNAFALYRDMGHTRTLRKVAEHLVETSTKTRNPISVESQLGGWSAKHRWQERVDAYVLHADQELVDARLEMQTRVIREDVDVAAKLLRHADSSLDALETSGMPLGPNEIPRYVEAASRIRRLAAGLSTDNVRGQLQITMQDLGRVVNAIVVGACEHGFVPEDRQEEFVRWVLEEASS
jgi:hypothetical protein